MTGCATGAGLTGALVLGDGVSPRKDGSSVPTSRGLVAGVDNEVGAGVLLGANVSSGLEGAGVPRKTGLLLGVPVSSGLEGEPVPNSRGLECGGSIGPNVS